LGNGIFTQEGLPWKHSRELLRKQFSRMQYQNLDHFREHVDNLIALLPVDGVVDLQPLFFKLTLDTATALLFGRSVYSLRANIDQDAGNRLFAESFTIAQEGLAKRFRIAPWHFLYSPREFRQACSTVHRFVERYLEDLDLQHEILEEKTFNFIKQVVNESGSKVEVRDQLLNVLLAGRDTTACCLSWTLYVLADRLILFSIRLIFILCSRLLVRHTHVMDRLRREVKSIMGESEHPTREQIRKMPYLACIIKESGFLEVIR